MTSDLETFAIDETDQLEELSAAEGWDLRYTQLETGSLSGRYSIAALGETNVHWERNGRGLHILGGLPPQLVPLHILFSASDRCAFHGREIRWPQLLVASPDDGIDFVARGSAEFLTIHVPRERLAAAWHSLGSDEPCPRTQVIDLGDRLGKLLADVKAAFDAAPGQAGELESNLLSGLVDVLDSSRGAGERRLDGQQRARYVKLAREYIHAHHADALRLEDLCREAGTGQRTLQRCFRELLGVSPLDYVRAVRLRAVRRQLRAAGEDVTVTEVALANGFFHLGHFGQGYKAMFGETPSDTLGRGRAEQVVV